MNMERLHYITQSLHGKNHAEMAADACENGVRWVQLRIKNGSKDEMLQQAFATLEVCRKFDAKLIINDHVHIAQAVKADGVHLGKTDMSPQQARELLGNDFIIGGTANTLEDIISLHEQKVDYVGLGPFRYTSTKENLSPVLGLDGYKRIIQKLNDLGIDLPVIAIGGIQTNDIAPLINIGVHGVAIASFINGSNNKGEAIAQIQKELEHGKITYSRQSI